MVNNNQYTYSFRQTGLVLGCLIVFFTAVLFSLELARVYSGSINRGQNNSTGLYQYLIYSDTIIGFNGVISNPKLENRWTWPWSTATLLFSLVFFMTGATGIVSGVRESYSSIYTFFLCSLLSLCFSIFIIATHSTTIAGWTSIYGTSDGNAMPTFARLDRNLSAACLTISCVLFIIFATTLVLVGRSIAICTRKEFMTSNYAYGHVAEKQMPRLS